jgi:membrane fusion protein (multidrug efflux system)
MKRSMMAAVVIAAIGAGGYFYVRRGHTGAAQEAGGTRAEARAGQGLQSSQGGRTGGPGRFGGGIRLPMTVEVDNVKRANMAMKLTVVGNLIGAATVEAVPKVSGRLDAVYVQLGDRVSRGQKIAKIEDHELVEQIRQARASYDVSAATIRQREADLRLAQTNLERSRNLFERQLIPRQTFDDTDSRHQAAVAQLDLAKAQHAQAEARLDELKINLANTVMTSPVSGFVGRRLLDAGAWVTPNSSFISVVDIGTVRLVANIVEKDLRKVTSGMVAEVGVDAFPGEKFEGRVQHIAPILDPATRTAQIEIQIDNPRHRLKPGMYASVDFATDHRPNTLVVPTRSVVDLNGNRGVFVHADGDTARFKAVTVGIIDGELAEVQDGLQEGERIITTGAAALREGDRIVLPGRGQDGTARGPRHGREGGDASPAKEPRSGAGLHDRPLGLVEHPSRG